MARPEVPEVVMRVLARDPAARSRARELPALLLHAVEVAP